MKLFQNSLKALLATLIFTLPLTAAPKKTTKHKAADYDFRPGDILFQATGGEQCRAIRSATHSPYSHCGVVVETDEKLFVFEAVSPVRITPLPIFRNRSLPGTFIALRLKTADTTLTPEAFVKADQWTQKQLGKNYDIKFLWDDKELYCSELVWKLYHTATGIKLSQPRRYDSYDLSSDLVKKLIIQRFGSMENFPAAELVVPPSDLAKSPLLEPVPKR